jgi:hypothetical protein
MGYSTHRVKTDNSSKYRYVLYADGTVVDRQTGMVAGYVLGSDLHELFKMRDSKEKQSRIIAHIT